jgi:hypothetical protein
MLSKTTLLALTGLILLFPNSADAFSDVASSHPNYEAIMYLYENGIIDGYSDGTYRPDSTINRAEFTKIIIESIAKTSNDNSNCFPDVKQEWFAQYICYAKDKQIISGYPDGTFKPANNISFVEAAKIISVAFNINTINHDGEWYKPFVIALEERMAIPLTIYAFDKPLTRGEMAEMIYRIQANTINKPTQTFSGLSGQVQQECQDSDAGTICANLLFELPKDIAQYRTDSSDSLQLFVDSNDRESLFVISNRFKDYHVFVNGDYKGEYDRFAMSADGVTDDVPVAIYGSGDTMFKSNIWDSLSLSDEVQNEIAGMYYFRINSLPNAFEASKTEAEQVLQTLKQDNVSLADLFAVLFFGSKGELPKFRDVFVSDIAKIDSDRMIVFLSFTTTAYALDIEKNTVIGLYEAYAPWSNEESVAKSTKGDAAFRVIKQGETKVVDGHILDAKSIWENNALLRDSYSRNVSFPRYSADGRLLYIGVNIEGEENDYTLTCDAWVGNKKYAFPCNDGLFSMLIAYTTAFRFPRVSPDGKTVVYPELVKPSVVEDDWLYPEEIFTTRLVVNGKPQAAHPWIDFPYFTDKGLAVVTHSDNNQGYADSYVEWDGKKVGPFQSLLPQLASRIDFRGYPPLFQSVHGDVGDTDLPDEIIVSPSGLHIAFSGYTPEQKWTLYEDMEKVESYDYIQHVMFNPATEHLAYVATSIDKTEPEPGIQVGEYKVVQMPFERKARSSVIENGNLLSEHDKVLWMQYTPNGNHLYYVAQNGNAIQLYQDGKPIGLPFDYLVMEPHFENGNLVLGFLLKNQIGTLTLE